MRDLRSQSRLCDRAREYSSRGLDGELSEFERALLDNHLERCAACRAYAAELEQIVASLRAAPLEALPHPISLPSRRRARGRVLQVAAASAAAAVAATAGLVGAIQSHPSATAPAKLNFATVLRAEDMHSQDVQVLHQSAAAAKTPTFKVGGQKPQ